MTAKTRTAKTALHACECSNWEFGSYGPDGDAESYESTGTGCTAQTNRVFAQGHDAKLVGWMVRAEGMNMEIRKGAVSFSGAVNAAGSISGALAAKAEVQVEAANRRAAKKAVARLTKKVTKAEVRDAVAATEAPKWRAARIKVGRWTYDAQIEIATGDATYTAKLGGNKLADRGTYTEVN